MKKLFLSLIVYSLSFIAITLSSCRKDMPIPGPQKPKPDTTGSWRSGKIFTIAGNGYGVGIGGGFSGDGGLATVAELSAPYGIAIDNSGNVYFADRNNYRIREINIKGIISTIAGNGNLGDLGDGGPATAAELHYIAGIAVDHYGNVYVADEGSNTVRIINTAGIISTFAGNGYGSTYQGGYSGDGGSATTAELGDPTDVAIDDSGNVYIACRANAAIRKVNTSGIITTVAGGVSGTYTGDGVPATDAGMDPEGVAVDAEENIYIADQENDRIRKVNTSGIISTIAGNGFNAPLNGGAFSGDGGPATAAELYYPTNVKVDAAGNVYINDSNNGRVRLINTNGIISTIAGSGPAGPYGFWGDGGLATDAAIGYSLYSAIDDKGNIYISDYWVERIRKVYK